ncbi:MAG: M6 family metalloprotease domain-containing protein [Bacteroidales bacterium]|nr:M6 family metalloprotease domain-containing protein [Bacteroidales bacterium]
MNNILFKKIAISLLLSFSFVLTATAAPIFNAPAVRLQPNGDTLRCLLSGDEYYHRLHDAAGYTIVQNPRTGYWVYADTVHTGENRWQVVATGFVAGKVDPAAVGLNPNIGIDRHDWAQRQQRYDIPKQYAHNAAKTSGRNHGTLNNIVIFVRFSDDSEISTPFSTIDAMFNDSTVGATSMYNYFKTVSYNKIHIPTHYYPTPSGNNVISYQDSLPRNYYMPYDATTNPTGYQGDNERASREFGLLERAVNYINTYSPVSTSINIDMDNDGYVDNICFVVKGTYTGWNDLLWPHKWALYDRYVYLNGKRVYTFNLQLEGSGEHYFSSSTFCHEMFHTLGAPDLYRYNVATNVTGVGSWDLMCSNTTPPQTMGAYMKWKYGNWIDSIPQITAQGTYTLHSLGDADYSNIAYKIAAQEPNQWYVLEYRDNTEQFETTLPGKGLVIYRIDERFNGNANFDGISTFDEVYLFRPGANDDTTNGYPAQAFFSANANRTQFSPTTDPHPWLTGNVIDTTISITNIGTPGETISFTYNDLRGCQIPNNLAANNITGVSAHLRWSGNAANYTLQWRPAASSNVTTVNVSTNSYDLTGLALDSEYQWRVRGECSTTDVTSFSDWHNLHTSICTTPSDETIGIGETLSNLVPINNYYGYSYTQMIYTSEQVGSPMSISKIAFNYSRPEQTFNKVNCTIYMGQTSASSFESTSANALIPFGQLTKVYEGPLNCVQGWNEFYLDTMFLYNGTDNLVIAIDDNSGQWENNDKTFYCTNTGNRYSSIIYYSDDANIDPANPAGFSGNKTRRRFLPDITLTGCNTETTTFYTVTIGNDTPERGYATGSGTFFAGTQNTIEAIASEHYDFSHWHSNISGADITDNPFTFTVDGDSNFTAFFVPELYHVSVSHEGDNGNAWFQVWEDGMLIDQPYTEADLEYGTKVSFYAEPTVDANGTHCTFSAWDSQGRIWANPLTLTLTSDTSLTAYYECETTEGIDDIDRAGITVAVANGNVTIDGAEGRDLEIVDILGRRIASRRGTGHDLFALPATGVYIIRIEGLAARKIVN